jgi:hypothetical protein
MLLIINQDATGGRAATYTNNTYGASIPSLTQTTTASKSDMLGLVKYGSQYRVVAYSAGFTA